MITKEWVAVHRKHHRFSDVEGDPHSPHVFGIKRIFLTGVTLYSRAAQDQDMIRQYGAGTPDDWLERCVYTPWNWGGISALLIIDVFFFGGWGFLVWGVQMLWIPFWAAGVINGLAHWWGYRNGTTRDHSRNISPWGIVVGGEELHNNHHLAPASARLSRNWWEFDIGWMYIRILSAVGLAKVK
jgi:stearoyl-CoA desaturase (delta-9 desaturase)